MNENPTSASNEVKLMSSLLSNLGIDQLSFDERLQLVQEIWESLEAEVASLPLSDAEKEELDRRSRALDANPGAVAPWEEVEARALARCRR